MKVKYDLVIDFARPSKSNTIIISEDDTNSRLLHFTLLNDKQPMSMSDVTSATVRAIKKDGTVVFGDAQILEDEAGNMINEVEYVIPSAISDTAGDVTMTITLNSMTNEQLTSFEIYIQVRNALYNEDDLVSESDLQGFRDLLNRALAAVKKVEDLSEDETLPNPYAFNLDVEGTTYSYTGRDEVNVSISDMAYIAEDPVLVVEALDQTAASMAAQSAEAAREYADQAKTSEDNVNRADVRITGYVEESRQIKNTVESAVGMAEAYGVLARENGLVAEGWAKGTQNGREVEEGSPYYNNNAEYFANKKSIENRLDSVATDKSLSANQGRILNDTKQNKLTAGRNITIEDNVISADVEGGTVDYAELENKPQINGVELDGNLNAEDLGIVIPNIPAWAMEANKPSYTASEVGALPDTTTIPSALSELTDDSTHRLVTDEQITKWNEGGGGSGGTTNYAELTNKPQIGGVELSGNKSAADLGLATVLSLTAEDGVQFNFVTDGEGNYGYLKADGSFVPFKSQADISAAYLNGIADAQKGNATADKVIAGITFTSEMAGIEVEGTMADNGEFNVTLNPGESITIPVGYTAGGTITANPNQNSGTYTFPSGDTGGTYDLGANNTIRYVNASNVYSKGKADGDVKHSVYARAYSVNTGTAYLYVDGKQVKSVTVTGGAGNTGTVTV